MKKLTTALLSILLIFNLILPTYAFGKTSEDIQKELEKANKELEQLNKDLSNAEKTKKLSEDKKNNSKNELERVKATLDLLEAELKFNVIKQSQIANELLLVDLHKQEKEQEQAEQLKDAYINWKTDKNIALKIIANTQEGSNVLKNTVYFKILNERMHENLKVLANELNKLNKSNQEYVDLLNSLEKETETLASKKEFLEKQIKEMDNVIARAEKNVDGVRAKLPSLQQQIDVLSAEQQAIKEQEKKQLNENDKGGTNPVIAGEIYFSGTGRDLYQGHGVGLSQFGAYGAAQKGWKADQIVLFYYANTRIEVRDNINISVQGYGTMSADNYVAGLGEVPSFACGTVEQIQAWKNKADELGWADNDPRRNKYVIDNPSTIWDCWPEEAIKAQIIAARSYGASNNGTICTTAACQVYVGGQAKLWAAWETSNMYIVSNGNTHNGQIIRALYSSDNSQGYGTANNDTIWSNFSGVGTPYSYLRHVNDSSVAASWTYTNWKWRTNGYTIQDIDQMFVYAANNYTTGGSNSFLKGLKNDVGTVTGISFERDGSNRVKIVQVSGTKGTKNISGWLFKAIWNDWVYNVKPSGQADYLYSVTFWLRDG
jgi:SpoIID/LytB domain protein